MSKRTSRAQKDVKKNRKRCKTDLPASRGVPGEYFFTSFGSKIGHKGGGGEAAAPLVTTFLAKRCEKVLPGYSPRRREFFLTSFPVLFDIFLGAGGSPRPLFRFFLESRKSVRGGLSEDFLLFRDLRSVEGSPTSIRAPSGGPGRRIFLKIDCF